MTAAFRKPDYAKTGVVAEVGQVISGKYKLLRLLGDGGMGSVFEAEHLHLGTRVAIKILHQDLTRRAGLIDRFLQEARVSAQIRSPHVVHVTDVDRTGDGIAYLVMELLQGEPLSNVVKRDGKLDVPRAGEYTRQILEALECAHALGVIHRDLKPDNVFVTFQGGKPVLKLIDFGIAKLKRTEAGQKNLTVAGMMMGTPEYMAPEQAYAADKVDVRADLYAVGVMLYEMLSGQTPVSGEDPRIVVLKVERGEVTPLVHAAPGTPPEIAGFVHRAMAPSPDLRFANATEMRVALEGALSGKRVNTAKLPASERPASEPDEHHERRTGTVMGAPAAEVLAAGGGVQGTGTTVRPPLEDHSAYGPPPPVRAAPPAYEPPPASARQGVGLIAALAVIALLLGAGAVVAYVVGTSSPSSPEPPSPFPTAPLATTPTPQAPEPTVTSTTPPGPPAAPLTVKPLPGPSPQPPPQAQKDAGATPAPPTATTTTTPTIPRPPFALPSGFPSAIPGFPSAFPSAIPLPSGFPTVWPPPSPPAE